MQASERPALGEGRTALYSVAIKQQESRVPTGRTGSESVHGPKEEKIVFVLSVVSQVGQ